MIIDSPLEVLRAHLEHVRTSAKDNDDLIVKAHRQIADLEERNRANARTVLKLTRAIELLEAQDGA